ncbi:baseplate J/gp47 family protein [Anaerocolumna sp. AGMB13025]|uniref:baseplate assembly protein n=1 Tax=Anaerocolumna sp. AGMB13025 TaxID=3039116 RepID=UPI00241CE523|nr:baseplate J/gp47 family protein [Anaerocolumna sp. AGMB13025]WFR55347.1 baseplate J/gp47 family protein [Anaerocolumna sp. AGMB13025]
MASDVEKLNSLPDISFIDGITADTVLDEMINDFTNRYYELTGEYEPLGELDKLRILMNAASLKIYQAYQYIEKTGKMNLLRYASGDYLLHLGATRGVEINEEKAAVCQIKFTLSDLQTSTVAIPKGTQVTAGDGVYFETEEYAEIPPGMSDVTVSAVCQATGTVGNGYTIGQLNVLVEPIPYVETVMNTSVSAGGEDIMSDDDFRQKIFLAPSSYSTAGPEDAYVFWARQYSALISDVKVITPSDDTVQVIILLKDGAIPDAKLLQSIEDYINDGNKKPLTEKVMVTAPTVIGYDIAGTYYINSSDKNNVTVIQSAVEAAVSEYVKWQKEKIGRDINPFHLQYLLMKAGVKRMELTSPVFATVDDTSIAIEGTVNITYGGIEDD